ncbi:hypothetical protein D1AOALGA4SA_1267 [Olavius algarvensis Delta 1 endosymbiont]|nr:hypothetical protein D1AOALGA4SA_1267 [Olavius algarvensis Delta 1 endosymbiont]
MGIYRLKKSQISSTKLQTNSNFQYPMTKTISRVLACCVPLITFCFIYMIGHTL